jgi:hypothetical protein
MLGIAIELRTQCAGCGQPLPLNACAETFVCASCGRANRIDAALWKSLLEDVVAEAPDLAADEGSNRTIMTGGASFALMYGRQAPRCRGCKAPMPEEAAAFADRGWTVCPACGQKLTLRRPPPALAALGITLVVGEDPAQINATHAAAAPVAPRAANPVVLFCPQCKAPLQIDGSDRLVRCQYCSTDVYLPDDLWQRLHPVATVARWYACLRDVDVAVVKRKSFEWYSLKDVVIDAERNLYCVGSASGAFDGAYLWSLGPDLETRWFAKLVGYSDDAQLAHDPRSGRLYVWQSGKHSLGVFSAADGAPITKLGGKQPDDAQTHTLDLDDGKWLRVDVDGTVLALLGERLVRFAPDGAPLPTWPPRAGLFGKKQEKLRPIYGPGHARIDVEGTYVENVGHHPTELDDYTNLHLGWDGRLYAERSEYLACFDRGGERVYRIKLPIDDLRGDYLGTDGAGNVYALGSLPGDPRPRVLVRVSPDGKRVDTIATDRLQGGVLGDEDTLIVAHDGTILVMRWWMCVRVLGPDGRLLHQTPRSQEIDREEDERIAKRA